MKANVSSPGLPRPRVLVKRLTMSCRLLDLKTVWCTLVCPTKHKQTHSWWEINWQNTWFRIQKVTDSWRIPIRHDSGIQRGNFVSDEYFECRMSNIGSRVSCHFTWLKLKKDHFDILAKGCSHTHCNNKKTVQQKFQANPRRIKLIRISLKGFCVNETTIAYNSQNSGYLTKCWNLTTRL